MRLTTRRKAELAREAVAAAKEADDIEQLSLDELLAMSEESIDAYLWAHGAIPRHTTKRDEDGNPVLVEMEMEEAIAAYNHDLNAQIQDDMGAENLVALDRGRPMDRAQRQVVEAKLDRTIVEVAQRVTRDTIREATSRALAEADPRPAEERQLQWITVQDDRICASCYDRHGIIDSADSWAGDGPGDNTTVCGKRCRCRLIPVDGASRDDEGLRQESSRGGLPERGRGR